MAITFIANALGGTTTTTSFSITLPTTQAGDLLILEFAHRGTGDGTIAGTSVTTGGLTWTLKHSQLFATSAFSGKTYWTRATGDHSGQTVTGASLTDSCAAIVTQYRGALAAGDPLTAATIVGEQNATGNETQAEITTNKDLAWVVLVVVNSPDVNVTIIGATSPVSMPERAERLSTGGTDTSVCHGSAEKATAGATGAFTWTQTDGVGGSWAYAITPALTAVLAETLHLSDIGGGTILFVSSGGLHIAEGPATAALATGGLTQSLTETLHVTDTATVKLTPLLVTLTETLHITEVVAPTMGGLSTSTPAETLHLSDVVTTARLTPLLVSLPETLHVADSTPTASLGSFGTLTAALSETLHISGAGVAQLSEVFGEQVRVADVVMALMGGLSITATETLHLSDVVTARLTPLLASVSETLHVGEAATPLLGGLATTATESLHVSETLTISLTPLFATLVETLHVSESPGTPSLTGDLARALTETLHITLAGRIEVLGTLRISETVSATLAGDLSQAVSETLHVADSASAFVSPLLGSLAETLHVTEGATAILPVLEARPAEALHLSETVAASLGLMAAPTETLHLTDVVTAAGGDLLAAPAETLHVSDTVAASLVASGTLTAALTETLHVTLTGEIQVLGRIRVSDGDLTVARQDPNDLTAAALAETLHLTDTPTAARVDFVLVASLAETLHLSEAVTALRSGAYEASVSESLHVADAVESYAGIDDPELVHVTETVTAVRTDAALTASLTETLHVSETATLRMGDLVAAVLTDVVHVTEAATASLTPLLRGLTETLHVADSAPGAALAAEGTLTTSLAETLHLAEALTIYLASLQAASTETLHLSESVTASMGLMAAPAETLHLEESVTGAALAAEGELTLALTESLNVQETVTARLSLLLQTVAETLHVSEAVTTSLELNVSLTEALHVAEGPPLAQQVGIALVVVVSEALALAEAVTDGRLTPLEAVLDEPLHVADEVTIYVAGTLLVDLTETVVVRETLYPERPPVIAGTAIFETTLQGIAIFHEE